MKALLRFLGNWWVLSIAAAVLVALLAVFLLPMLIHGLRPWPWRLMLILIVAAVWGVAALVRFLLGRRASARLAAALEPDVGARPDEMAVLDSRMKDALGRLKADSGGRRDYLYSRPWYAIIGPPGAGKTTALLNSGLRFPYADSAVKGVGGTRNLDFWFADQAVLVDTAGRYTSQDSDQERDRSGWGRFLELLRLNRPLSPINGVLVAISLDSLAEADCAALDRQADTIRLRLRELREGLQTVAPVYVMFTKSDLIAGFREFHDDLDVEGRRAVLGASLPLSGPRDARTIAVAFDEVAQAVADRTSGRIQSERDPRRRGLIIGFPAQIESLRNNVVRLLTGIFPADGTEAAETLRGFYFTSGVQEGAPLDVLLSDTAALADSEPDSRSRGRAYFINRLLTEVVLGEAGLARPTQEARKRRSTITMAAYAGMAAVASILLLAWTANFVATLGYQRKVLAAANEIQPSLQGMDLQQVSAADPGIADVTPVLDKLRALPGGYADRRGKGFPKFPLGFGLFDDGLSQDAEATYQVALQRVLMPRLLLRMEDALRGGRERPIELYSTLRAYRLLAGDAPPKIRKRDIGSVGDWVEADWNNTSLARSDLTLIRQSLGQHLDALLEDPQLGDAWGGNRVAPFDPDLVASSKSTLLAQLTPGQRGYAILRDLPASGKPWKPNLRPEKYQAFADPGRVQSLSVPYLFTREGYLRDYQARLQKVVDQLAEEGWVLDDETVVPLGARVQFAGEIAEAYAAEYTRRWKEVLAALAPADYIRNDAAAQALLAPPSALATMLSQVRKETNLSLPGKKLPQVAGLDAGARITADFATLGGFDVNAFISLVKQVKEASLRSKTDPTAAAALQQASAQLEVMKISMPAEDMRGFVSNAAGLIGNAGASISAEALMQEYQQTILPACRRVTEMAYPFVRSAPNDASRREVADFFRPGGVLDQFVKGKLASYIEPAGSYWRWKTTDPVAQRFKSSPDRFKEASDLQALMSDGLRLEITALTFSPGTEAVEVRIGNAAHVFTRGDVRPISFQWTPSDNPSAMVSFQGTPDYIAGNGEWALFRLFGQASELANSGSSMKATFAKGGSSATFRVVLSGNTKNPLRDGPWGFRCPAEL